MYISGIQNIVIFFLFIIVLYILKLQHLLPATKMAEEDLDINTKVAQ